MPNDEHKKASVEEVLDNTSASELQPPVNGSADTAELSLDADINDTKDTEAPEGEPEITLGFYFDNICEFVAYAAYITGKKITANLNSIRWLSADSMDEDPYQCRVAEGVALYENHRHRAAIAILQESLQYNPVGLHARFEICENYLKMHDLDQARKTLKQVVPFLVEQSTIARYYRRMGYIYTELGQLKTAYACLYYSSKFEEVQLAITEMEFIIAVAKARGENIKNITNTSKTVARLKDANIPVITKVIAACDEEDADDDIVV